MLQGPAYQLSTRYYRIIMKKRKYASRIKPKPHGSHDAVFFQKTNRRSRLSFPHNTDHPTACVYPIRSEPRTPPSVPHGVRSPIVLSSRRGLQHLFRDLTLTFEYYHFRRKMVLSHVKRANRSFDTRLCSAHPSTHPQRRGTGPAATDHISDILAAMSF